LEKKKIIGKWFRLFGYPRKEKGNKNYRHTLERRMRR
jgi:hypothetical protein